MKKRWKRAAAGLLILTMVLTQPGGGLAAATAERISAGTFRAERGKTATPSGADRIGTATPSEGDRIGTATSSEAERGETATASNGRKNVSITGWEWVDPDQMLAYREETGEWVLALPGVSGENPVAVEEIKELLPSRILAGVEREKGPDRTAEKEEIVLSGWSCGEFPAEGEAVQGSYRFTGELPEGFVLGETAEKVEVTVELGGAMMLAEPVSLDISVGNIVITKTGYKRSDDQKETPHTGAYVISGEVDKINQWVEVRSGTHQITLNGLKIETLYRPAFHIEPGASVEMNLAKGTVNELRGGAGHSGIEVPEGAKLILKGEGELLAVGKGSSAGIGGYATSGNAGEIVIESGTITAHGDYGAGIGGGSYGAGGTIQILEGSVTAEGGLYSAGIGGGSYGAAGTIRIEGGVVMAQGGKSGAGIGGGCAYENGWVLPDAVGVVTINGGEVKAAGGEHGAGIGGGSSGKINSVVITGGLTEASGGNQAAGIGSGTGSSILSSENEGNVTIEGNAVVTAKGKTQGAGIGGGFYFKGGTVSIGGNAVVSACGGIGVYSMEASGPGIGGGMDSQIKNEAKPVKGKSLTISGSPWIDSDSVVIGSEERTDTIQMESIIRIESSSVLFDGSYGTVRGNYTLNSKGVINSGKTLNIPSGTSLTVEGSLENNGTLYLKRSGILKGNGTLSGNGQFLSDLTNENVRVPEGLNYTGEDQTEYALQSITIGTATIMGQNFSTKSYPSDCTKSVTPYPVKEVGDYTAVITSQSEGIVLRKNFTVSRGDSVISARTYSNNKETTEFHHGELITVKARAAVSFQSRSGQSRMAAEPAENQMALYFGDTRISDVVSADAAGVYTMTGVIPGKGGSREGEPSYRNGQDLNVRFGGNSQLKEGKAVLDVNVLHEFGEDGFCTVCDQYEPAVLTETAYEIGNAGQLYWFSAMSRKDNAYAEFPADPAIVDAVLINNIVINTGDVAGCGGQKQEDWREWKSISSYAGKFDGRGHTISGMYGSDAVFETVMKGASVSNLGLENSFIKNDNGAGGIALINRGRIENCWNTGTVAAERQAGGIAMDSYGSIINCWNSGKVEAATSYAAGISAIGRGEISGCYNSGEVKAPTLVGGISGLQVSGRIKNCYNTGPIEMTRDTGYIGGLVGRFRSRDALTNCFNTGRVTGPVGANRGAICSFSEDTIAVSDCYYLSGSVSGDTAVGNVEGKGNVSLVRTEPRPSEDFASGEVTWLLNGGTSESGTGTQSVWRQNLDKLEAGGQRDSIPQLSGNIVYRHKDGTYSNYPEQTVSVSVTWGPMAFTFQENWNPQIHEYEGAWMPDDRTAGGKITVENQGDVEVKILYSYEKDNSWDNHVEGLFISDPETMTPVNGEVSVGAGDTAQAWLTLTGRPEADLQEQKLGAVTVHLAETGGDIR